MIMLAAKPMLRILTTDQAVIDTTYEMMTYFVPYYFTWSVIEVLSAVLRGAGDAVRPVAIIGLGICLLRISTRLIRTSKRATAAAPTTLICLLLPVKKEAGDLIHPAS